MYTVEIVSRLYIRYIQTALRIRIGQDVFRQPLECQGYVKTYSDIIKNVKNMSRHIQTSFCTKISYKKKMPSENLFKFRYIMVFSDVLIAVVSLFHN